MRSAGDAAEKLRVLNNVIRETSVVLSVYSDQYGVVDVRELLAITEHH